MTRKLLMKLLVEPARVKKLYNFEKSSFHCTFWWIETFDSMPSTRRRTHMVTRTVTRQWILTSRFKSVDSSQLDSSEFNPLDLSRQI